ncbi:MAG: hypothetical protein AB4041_13545 [Microcystaceae cyanobacterium]
MNDVYTAFLGEIMEQCFSCQVKERHPRERAFLQLRFHPDYKNKQHKEIAVEMKQELGEMCQKSIPTTCQNVVHKIADIYQSEMENDGVNVEGLRKRERGQKGAWEEVYRWLHDHKFYRWFSDYTWKNWQQQAQNKPNWLGFLDKDARRGMVVTPIVKNNTVNINQPVIMQVSFEEKERYLLLLNRGKSKDNAETRFIVCPSLHFAPKIEPVINLSYLPQSDAHLQDIKFDEIGQEEYMGILVKEIPDLDWLNPDKQGELPIWDEHHLYQLWQALEEQGDYQTYYQKFEVV